MSARGKTQAQASQGTAVANANPNRQHVRPPARPAKPVKPAPITTNGHATSVQRAQSSAALQHQMGNARINAMMVEPVTKAPRPSITPIVVAPKAALVRHHSASAQKHLGPGVPAALAQTVKNLDNAKTQAGLFPHVAPELEPQIPPHHETASPSDTEYPTEVVAPEATSSSTVSVASALPPTSAVSLSPAPPSVSLGTGEPATGPSVTSPISFAAVPQSEGPSSHPTSETGTPRLAPSGLSSSHNDVTLSVAEANEGIINGRSAHQVMSVENPPQAHQMLPQKTPPEGQILAPEASTHTVGGAMAAALPDIGSGGAAMSPAPSIPSGGRAKADELSVPSGMILPTLADRAPIARSEGARLILEEITAAASASRETVADRIAQGLEAIIANVREQHQLLMVTGEWQTELIRGIFMSSREQVTQVVTNARSKLQADAASQLATLEGGHAGSLAQADESFVFRQERAQVLGDTYSDRAIETANEAAQQLQSRREGYSQEARNIGQAKARAGSTTPEIGQTKAEVANELASDTATVITESMSDAMAQLSSSGPPTADAIREQGQEAARQLGTGQVQVVDQLINTNQHAISAVQETITAGNQALAGLEIQLLGQLLTLENSLVTQLQAQIAQKSQEIGTAGQQTIDTFQEQGRQAMSAGDKNLAGLSAQIASMNIEQSAAPEAAKRICGHINGAYDSLIKTADGAFQQVDGAISQGGADLIGAIENVSRSVDRQGASFLTQARSQISQQCTAIGTQLTDTVTHTTTAENSMVDQVTGSLDGHLSQLDQSFAKGLGDYLNHLNGQVISAENQAREPATSLASRIDQGQSRAEIRAQQGFWERQWNDFKEMVSDPGFLVGLIVGLVLAVIVIVLITASILTGGLAIVAVFAVVGAIAAAAGSVVSQATKGSFSGGWDWSRVSGWEVLKAAGIGAVFGAVLAGAAVLMGPALAGSLTGIAIISGLTGLLTIAMNLISGQAWDKNLLANMVFAGVLSWLGKYIRIPGRNPIPESEISPGGPLGEEPPVRLTGEEPPVRPPGEEPSVRTSRITELPPEEVSRLVSEGPDGSFKLNRKNINNVHKIVGEPEATVVDHAAREAYAAELAAGLNNVEKVYLGQAADKIVNAQPGVDLSVDVVGITRQGKYVLIEAKGTEILHGLEQLEHSANSLGREQVVRYELVVPEVIRTPGFSIDHGLLQLNGKPYLINGKVIHVRTTTHKR